MHIEFSSLITTVLSALIFVGVVFGVAYVFPWRNIDWGNLRLMRDNTVITTGYAKTEQKNQIAQFTAGVSAVNDKKETAVDEVNKKTQDLIAAIKKFGIAEGDIQTQNFSIYQMEQTYYEEGTQKSRPGQWRVSNDVSIKLRDVAKASELATMLAQSGATNVWGPNFAVDNTQNQDAQLLEMAITDARVKAEAIAKASGKTLGEVVNVTEGGASDALYPLARMEGAGGGGVPTEAGSTTVSKTVTVTFEFE